MRYFSTLFFFLILINVSFGFQKADSILQDIATTEGTEKLDKWKYWFNNVQKGDLQVLHDLQYKAFADARAVVGQDSAVIWLHERRRSLIRRLREFGQGSKATEVLDKLKASADSLSAVNGKTHWTVVDFYYTLADFHYMLIDLERAEELFEKAIKINNEEVRSPRLTYKIHNLYGLMKSYQGETEKAIELFSVTDSLVNQPFVSTRSRLLHYVNKAYVYNKAEKFEIANDYYKKAYDSLHLFANTLRFRVIPEYAANLCRMGKVKDGLGVLEKWKDEVFEVGTPGAQVLFAEEYTEALFLSGQFEKGRTWVEKTRAIYYNSQEDMRAKEVLEWRAKYEAEEKEAEITKLESEQIATQNKLLIISLIGLLGLGILSFFFLKNKNKQKQLALQIEKDKQIAENRDRLFSSITHDIRTPLALMLAPLERAEDKSNDGAVKADINLARRNGKRLMELFNQILDWNKAEAKALQLNPQVGQLKMTFDNLCDRYQQQAVEKGIKFTHDVHMPKGQHSLDYDKLDKIISNLVGNAIKFCEVGQGVFLKAAHEKKVGTTNDYQLLIEVRDQGPGIGVEEQQSLFNRYVQGKQGKLKGGTGIGLALVKELTDMMGGDIRLESEVGKGATFFVKLPFKKVEEMAVESLQSASDLSVTDASNSAEKTLILVVEDEPELREFLQSALSTDYEVESANTATTGLNIAINRIPEIIISDWTLPDNNGGWLCQQVAKNELTAHIPVMVLTAHNSDTNQKAAFDAGAVAWMNKPFQLSTLKRQLNTILMQQQRAQNLWAKKVGNAIPEAVVKSAENVTDKQVEQSETPDPFMEKVFNLIETNYDNEQYSVEKMAEELFLSRVQLFRKVKSITGNTPKKIINEFRLTKAQQLLRGGDKSVSEVCFEVGFSDPSYFTKLYKQHFNVNPSQERVD
ncbi:MAG: ATP-binding protein [Bacteroidota bacterium]